jgi:uncharacterized protein (DUF433 family)
MQLEDYFEFEKCETPHGLAERIRIKGHRIAIEHVIEFYKQGVSAEDIVKVHYPTLTPEEVYATLTYYLHNREAVDAYIQRGEKIADAYYQEHLRKEPSEVVKRLQALRSQPDEIERLHALRRQQATGGKDSP